MKNKRNSERDDYRLLKNKLLIRIFGMLFFAFAFLAALYSLFLKGHIADTFVGFLDNFVYHDYDRAYNVYSIYIRDYMSIFYVVLSLLLFAIILRFYLNEFSKYFKEINRSIDALIEENSGDIVLPSELTAIEKKINHIKHTLEQRKLAAELCEKFPNVTVDVYEIVNHFFGEQITVSGLMTGTDLKEQLQGKDLGETLLLPVNILRSGEDVQILLDDITIPELENTLQIPISIVQSNGQDLVDKILGRGEIDE